MPQARQSTSAGFAPRLWVLERPPLQTPTGGDNVFRFVSAVALLLDRSVDIGFIRSLDADRTTGTCLERACVRLKFERNAVRFASLDDALMWAESKRLAWIDCGWTDVPSDPDDC